MLYYLLMIHLWVLEKKKILFASVLKPADEVRMYKKLGASLSDSKGLDLLFFGSKKMASNHDYGIFLDGFSFNRNPFKRIQRIWNFAITCFTLKPDLLVICTWELLVPAIFYRAFWRKKIIYDLQENYFKNILAENSFKRVVLIFPAMIVRWIERISVHWISGILVAEECYFREITFTGKRGILLENKAIPFEIPKIKKRDQVVYSGTISIQTGLGELEHFLKTMKGYTLVVIGHCPKRSDQLFLHELSESYPNLKLNISNEPIPYDLIREEIRRSKFSFAFYQNFVSIKDRIPTCFFESLAYSCYILASGNPTYQEFFKKHGNGKAFNSSMEAAEFVIDQNIEFDRDRFSQEDVCWITEKDIFKSQIQDLLMEIDA